MTEQSPDLSGLVAMVYIQELRTNFESALRGIPRRDGTANRTTAFLLFDHLFVISGGYAIDALQMVIPPYSLDLSLAPVGRLLFLRHLPMFPLPRISMLPLLRRFWPGLYEPLRPSFLPVSWPPAHYLCRSRRGSLLEVEPVKLTPVHPASVRLLQE